MDTQSKSDLYLHSIMCLIGGFLGAYAILIRCNNLGSAQTANLLYIVVLFLGKNMKEFSLRLLGAILYFLAIELYVYISHKTKINIQRYSILVNMIGCLILCFISEDASPIVGLLPLFFMTATQWSVFHGANGYNSSTIFSTNNLRQTALAIGEYLCNKDKKQLEKMKFFSNSLFWYHIGAAISFFACKTFGVYASLLCLIPACIGLTLTCKDAKLLSLFIRKNTIA